MLRVCVGLMLGFACNNLAAKPISQQQQPPKPATQQPADVWAKKLEGDWEGIIDAGAAKVKLILHVVRKDGALAATLDVPDQGATGLAVDPFVVSEGGVRFELKANGAVFEGKLTPDGSQIDGEWKLELPHPLPLIKAGAIYRLEVLSEDRTCGDAEGYRPLQSNRIEIASVVFVGGSYEGDSGLAALIRGRAMGNKRNLDRVMAVLSSIDGNEESIPDLLVYHLRSLSEGMDEVAEPFLAEALRNSLPPEGNYSMSGLTNFIRSGQHEIKTNLRGDAQQLERLIKSQNSEAVKKWCAFIMAKYASWHALAEAVSTH
jgi:hypothetical protein